MNRDSYGFPIEIRAHYAQQYAAGTAAAQSKGKGSCGCEHRVQAEMLPSVQQLLANYVPPDERYGRGF